MKHRNFPTSPAPGNRINVHLPWATKIADNSDDADRICSDAYFHMKEKLGGREPTKNECLYGPSPADNRSLAEKMERDSFRPKKNASVHAMDRLADSLPIAEQKYNPRERYANIAADCRSIAERDRGNAEATALHKEKLKRLAPQLRDIDAKLDAENWRAEKGSQRIADLLGMLRLQLVEGSDPAEEKRLRSEVNALLSERTKIETLRQVTLRDALQSEIDRLEKSGTLLAEGESIESLAEESVRLAQAEADAVAAREKGDARLAELAAAREALQ